MAACTPKQQSMHELKTCSFEPSKPHVAVGTVQPVLSKLAGPAMWPQASFNVETSVLRIRALINATSAGCLIGRQGHTIQFIRESIQQYSPIDISIAKPNDQCKLRTVTLTGSPAIIARAILNISFVILGDNVSNAPHRIRLLIPEKLVDCLVGTKGLLLTLQMSLFINEIGDKFRGIHIDNHCFRKSSDRLLTFTSYVFITV
jgi:hypothetical protein